MNRRARYHLLLAAAGKGKREVPKKKLQVRQALRGNETKLAQKPPKKKTLEEQMGELKFRAGLMIPTFSYSTKPSTLGRRTKSSASRDTRSTISCRKQTVCSLFLLSLSSLPMILRNN